MAIRTVAIYEVSKQVKSHDGAYVDIAEFKRRDLSTPLQHTENNDRVVVHSVPVQHLRDAKGKDEYIALGPKLYRLLLSASEARAGEELLRERRAHDVTKEALRSKNVSLEGANKDFWQALDMLDDRDIRIENFVRAPIWRRIWIAITGDL